MNKKDRKEKKVKSSDGDTEDVVKLKEDLSFVETNSESNNDINIEKEENDRKDLKDLKRRREMENNGIDEENGEKEGKEGKEGKKSRKRQRPNIESSKIIESDDDDDDDDDDDEMGVFSIYVGHIPYECDEDDLKEIFQKFGKITGVRMPRYNDSGRPRGYAHIDFISKKGRNKAVKEMDKYLMGKMSLSVQVADGIQHIAKVPSQPPPEGCCTLFVKNLSYETDESEVSNFFSKFGKLRSVRLGRWNHTRKLKGFGYVDFQDPRSLVTAINTAKKANGLFMNGRNLQLDYEVGKPKQSFRDANGRLVAQNLEKSKKRKATFQKQKKNIKEMN